MPLRWSGWEFRNQNSFNSFRLSLKLVKKIDFPSDILVLSLFAIYSLTLAPYLTTLLDYGDTNYFVAFFGFAVYILEVFAFRFKMHMTRLRAEEERILIKHNTGKEVLIPRVGIIAWIGFFIRSVFRTGILVVSIYALNFSLGGEDSIGTVFATLILLIVGVLDIILSGYLMVKSGLFNPEALKKWEFSREWEASEKWAKEEFVSAGQKNFYIKELLSDIVLNIYSFMLYSVLWEYINEIAIEMTQTAIRNGDSALDAGLNLFGMLFFLIMFMLPTLRLAYWIEGYALAFADKERWSIRWTFCIAAVVTISPAIITYFQLYFPR